MRTMLLWIVAYATCLLAGPCSAAAAPELPPAEAFGTVPAIANVELSPGGNLLAWSDDSRTAQKVVVFDLGTRAVTRTLDVGADMKVRGLDWADDKTLLLHVSVADKTPSGPRYKWFHTLAASVTSGKTRLLLMADRTRPWVVGSTLLALHTARPGTVIMSSWDFAERQSAPPGDRGHSGGVLDLFEVNSHNGKSRRIGSGSQFTREWVVDAAGRVAARSEWDERRQVYRVLRIGGDGWEEIHRQEGGGSLSLYGLTADGSAIVAVGANGHGRSCLWSIPLDGSGAKVLLEDPDRDVERVALDPYSRTPIGAWLGGLEPQFRWLDSKAQARTRALERTFENRPVTLYRRSQDGSRVLARVASRSIPATYYLVDFAKGTADIVAEDHPALVKATLGEVRAMSYKARDGMEIPSWLTIPPGAPAGNLPLVVLPHGGPQARDDTDFDWMAQFLATRGYLVFQPQFRGSTGFGDAYRKAGYHQWGGLMQDDVTDGVATLVRQGMADPRRIGIVGLGYGGYAALAGAAFTPDLYACAVSVGGVSDLPAMLGDVAKRSGDPSDALAYWQVHIGSPSNANVIEKSPARAANKVRAPVLLLHGVDDAVVPISQSETMARELEKLGKPYTFIRLPGDDHWLSRGDTRLRVLQEFESFLAEHLGGSE